MKRFITNLNPITAVLIGYGSGWIIGAIVLLAMYLK